MQKKGENIFNNHLANTILFSNQNQKGFMTEMANRLVPM